MEENWPLTSTADTLLFCIFREHKMILPVVKTLDYPYLAFYPHSWRVFLFPGCWNYEAFWRSCVTPLVFCSFLGIKKKSLALVILVTWRDQLINRSKETHQSINRRAKAINQSTNLINHFESFLRPLYGLEVKLKVECGAVGCLVGGGWMDGDGVLPTWHSRRWWLCCHRCQATWSSRTWYPGPCTPSDGLPTPEWSGGPNAARHQQTYEVP